MLGIATIRPKAVLYNATEMPWASTAGLLPTEVCAPKISIMPTSVPNSPSNGLIEAMVPSVVRKRSRLWATARPASSMDSFITSGGLLMFFSPAAKMHPSGELSASRVSMLSLTPRCFSSLITSSSKAGGDTRLARRKIERSIINPRAITEARIKNQIGQPAASIIANTWILRICLN